MITALDSSVLLDILTASPIHLENSLSLYRHCLNEGKVIVCPTVWGEIRPFFDSAEEMENIAFKMGFSFDELGQSAANLAGELWKKYRKQKGPRERLIADFLIGAHAQTKAERFLSRDRGFYRTYFPHLNFLDPTHFKFS